MSPCKIDRHNKTIGESNRAEFQHSTVSPGLLVILVFFSSTLAAENSITSATSHDLQSPVSSPEFDLGQSNLSLKPSDKYSPETIVSQNDPPNANESFGPGREKIPKQPEVQYPSQTTPADRKLPAELQEKTRSLDRHPKPWHLWQDGTGDWRGLRPWLWRHGIIPEFLFTGEIFSNLHGGKHTGTQAISNLDISVTLNTDLLGLWSNGLFFIHLQNNLGKGISEDYVGNINTISNLDPAPRFNWTQLSQFYYQHSAFDDKLQLILGKQDANTHFAVPHFAEPLVNASFDLTLNVPMPTFPDSGMGITTLVTVNDEIIISGAIYNGNTDNHGNTALFSHMQGVFSIAEFEFQPTWNGYNGYYRMGGWFNNNDVKAIRPESQQAGNEHFFNNNYGFYIALDQGLTQVNSPQHDENGFGVFFQLGWAPEDRNETPLYIGGGLGYKGLIPGREDDSLQFGVAHAQFSNRLPNKSSETVLELAYTARITPWLHFKPDIQYVINPDGNGRDALVMGLRMLLDL